MTLDAKKKKKKIKIGHFRKEKGQKMIMGLNFQRSRFVLREQVLDHSFKAQRLCSSFHLHQKYDQEVEVGDSSELLKQILGDEVPERVLWGQREKSEMIITMTGVRQRSKDGITMFHHHN